MLFIISMTIFAMNSHILFRNGYVDRVSKMVLSKNGSWTMADEDQVTCYKARDDRFYIFPKWERIHLALYNLVPFAIMVNKLLSIKFTTQFTLKLICNKFTRWYVTH